MSKLQKIDSHNNYSSFKNSKNNLTSEQNQFESKVQTEQNSSYDSYKMKEINSSKSPQFIVSNKNEADINNVDCSINNQNIKFPK